MKRKCNIVMLALIGALVLNGCGSNKKIYNKEVVSESSDSGNEESENNTDSKETDTTSQSSVEETDESNTKEQREEGKRIPMVAVTSVREEWYTDDNEVLLLETEGNKVSVENEGFDALKNALEERFVGIDGEVYERLFESAKDHYEVSYMGTDEYFPAYSSNERVEITRCDSQILSIRVFDSEYSGGAHGFTSYEGVNFNAETGKELEISDILTDKEGFYETAPAYIADVLYEEYEDELFSEYKDLVNKTFSENGSLNWYLNATGIVVIYNSYELGPYAMDEVEVVLPYEEFAKYIDTKYISVRGEAVARIPKDKEINDFLGEDGKIYLKTQWTEYENRYHLL